MLGLRKPIAQPCYSRFAMARTSLSRYTMLVWLPGYLGVSIDLDRERRIRNWLLQQPLLISVNRLTYQHRLSSACANPAEIPRCAYSGSRTRSMLIFKHLAPIKILRKRVPFLGNFDNSVIRDVPRIRVYFARSCPRGATRCAVFLYAFRVVFESRGLLFDRTRKWQVNFVWV